MFISDKIVCIPEDCFKVSLWFSVHKYLFCVPILYAWGSRAKGFQPESSEEALP